MGNFEGGTSLILGSVFLYRLCFLITVDHLFLNLFGKMVKKLSEYKGVFISCYHCIR